MKIILHAAIISIIFCVCTLFSKAQVIPDSLRVNWFSAGYAGTIPEPALIINVRDFGAYGDSLHDDYNAIMNAINSSANLRIIFFPAGNYLIKSTLVLSDNSVLRGEGGASNLIFDLSPSGGKKNCIDISKNQKSTFTSVTGGYIKGSNSLTVISTSGMKVNDWAEIREANGSWDVHPASWAKYCVGQIVQIKAINDHTLTIEPSLHIDFTQNLSPEIRSISLKKNIGIECLKITRVDSPVNGYGYNINFSFAENCWVTGIESNKSQGSHIFLTSSAHITISGCYCHNAFTYDGTGTSGYGVTMVTHTSDCKVENSIFEHLRHAMVLKQGANGNVFAYNYSFDPYRSETPNDAGGDMLLHGHYAFANLFEGNVGQNLFADDFWGPAGPYNTFFRNRAELYGIVIFDQYNYNVKTNRQNLAGNEVTDTGFQKGNYLLAGSDHFQYGNNIKGIVLPLPTDSLPESSYYLSKQPYFWNITQSWPSIGIPNELNTGTNPAKERYFADGDKTSCIKEPGALSAIASTDSIVCNGAIAAITVTASGGTGNYRYSIDETNFQTENIFSKNAGSYTIFVTDDNGDTVITAITVQQAALIKIAVTSVNPSCKTASDGSIIVTATKGISPYQYNLNGGAYQSSNVFTNLGAGTYSVSVRDAKGCTTTKTKIKLKKSSDNCNGFLAAGQASADNMNYLDVKISPNPSKTNFSLIIERSSKAPAEIKVTDMYGRQVYKASASFNQTYYFGDAFAEGVYIVQIIQHNNFKTFKIIKQ